ncbi:MAG: DUF3786 domain-containing protein [Nitrospirae bacterium]|nr:DUF3786 domain-containing protein [Nitrospirota bacterium]
MGENRIPGEMAAWDELSRLDPADVCRNAGAAYDASEGVYLMDSFGIKFRFRPASMDMLADDERGAAYLGRLGYFYRLSSVWYLVKAQAISPSGRLLGPSNLKGGQLFFRGSHVLPLPAVAAKYNDNPGAFTERGLRLGGVRVSHGDEAVELRPFPRIPVTLLLWRGDDEFPPRADILFDDGIEKQLPLDIIWSVAMMSVLSFL